MTVRQHRVLILVARGLTTKEMVHDELGITERGVAAHISRMLAKSGAHNRAGLIAHALSADLGGAVSFDSATELVCDSRSLDAQQELIAYEDALHRRGHDGSRPAPRLPEPHGSRLDRRSALGRPHREVFQGGASQNWRREKGDEAFSTGRPVVISAAPSRWQRGDGTWVDEIFSCVAQPLRDGLGEVRGVLWICATGHR
jgi:DNA-binding CsgD family transcriptional regulator